MDFLSHLFIPLTAAYVLRPDWFRRWWHFGAAGFGLVADADKFLGMPGLFHSLLTLGPLCCAVVGGEYLLRREVNWSLLVVALVLSHLVLDVVDGGPVPLLYPLVETGIGLEYPVRTVFGEGLLGLRFEGALVQLRTTAPRPGFNQYGFIQGAGVASALLFVTILVGNRTERTG